MYFTYNTIESVLVIYDNQEISVFLESVLGTLLTSIDQSDHSLSTLTRNLDQILILGSSVGY